MAKAHGNSSVLLEELYNSLKMPVLVCRRDDALGVMFLNAAAQLLFAPSIGVDALRGGGEPPPLATLLRFCEPQKFQRFLKALRFLGKADFHRTSVYSFQDDVLPVRLCANSVTVHDTGYFVIYVSEGALPDSEASGSDASIRILKAAHHAGDVEDALRTVLELAGDHARASRSYVFEHLPPNSLRNTYEWCADGIASVIGELQNLRRENFIYDALANSAGVVVTEDTNLLPDPDRKLLRQQGVKSLAILPLHHAEESLGYVGFDDCVRNRQWSLEDVRFFEYVASVLATLLIRRNAERDARRNLEIAQAVTDNLADLVYISDLETHELKFVSKSLARAVNLPAEAILGKTCWSTLHRDQDGPCSFCPIPKLLERRGTGDGDTYIWELHNSVNGKWYMVKDTIVDWIDSRPAHLGTMVEITYRKQYEEQLKRFAATDAMTDVYNRKWGYGKLEALYAAPREERALQTLCFIDVDGLKTVNDHLGHAAGDEMIVHIIRTILSCVRKDDFISRWGGDEFVLFLNCPHSNARIVMEKIQFAIEHFNSARNKPFTLAISYGMVDFSLPADSLKGLIDEADRLMYLHKAEKRRGGSAEGKRG